MLQWDKVLEHLPRDLSGLPVLTSRVISILAIQGVVILAWYAVIGSPADPERLPFGLQLDPLHAVVHLALGVGGAYAGFVRPTAALNFVRLFSVVYLSLAVLGTFTDTHLGMHLEFEENLLHWTAGSGAAVIGFGLAPRPTVQQDAR
jgi:hypothetical protein